MPITTEKMLSILYAAKDILDSWDILLKDVETAAKNPSIGKDDLVLEILTHQQNLAAAIVISTELGAYQTRSHSSARARNYMRTYRMKKEAKVQQVKDDLEFADWLKGNEGEEIEDENNENEIIETPQFEFDEDELKEIHRGIYQLWADGDISNVSTFTILDILNRKYKISNVDHGAAIFRLFKSREWIKEGKVDVFSIVKPITIG